MVVKVPGKVFNFLNVKFFKKLNLWGAFHASLFFFVFIYGMIESHLYVSIL